MVTVRITADFQGYARDLHDQASEHFATMVSSGNDALKHVLLARFKLGRKLDTGNPRAAALGADFGLLGLSLWPALKSLDPAAKDWNEKLEKLVDMRSAVAHGDEARMESLALEGFPLARSTITDWQKCLKGLVPAMDKVVAAYLSSLLGGPAPW